MIISKGTKIWIPWSLNGLLVGTIIFILLWGSCYHPKPVVLYKTDTLRVPIAQLKVDTVTIKQEVPPKLVTIYQWDTIRLKPFVAEYDTIYLEKPGNYLTFNPKYLRNWPDRPKILEGYFQSDTIRLTLLDTSGYVTRYDWPVGYQSFDYYFNGHKLEAVNKPHKGTLSTSNLSINLPKISQQGNVYLTYNPLFGGARLSADYSVMFKRIGPYIYGAINTYPKYVDGGVGIRFQFR